MSIQNGGRSMIVGVFLFGTGMSPSSWRLPEVDVNASRNSENHRQIVTDLKKSGVTQAFLIDIFAITDLAARVISHDPDATRRAPVALLAALSTTRSRMRLSTA